MTSFERAIHDPKGIFKEPKHVVADKDLSKEEKIKILRQWEYDAREQLVAEEENMPDGPNETFMLRRIKEALRELGVEGDEGEHSSKQ